MNAPRRGPRSALPRLVGAAVVAAAVVAGSPLDDVNAGGWPQVRRFLAAAVDPELSGGFLALIWREALVTVAFAVLGTALALVIGLVGGVLTARLWWSAATDDEPRCGWHAVRLAAAIPRSLHEVVWALLLLNVLGLDPLVAVLAIGLPFGAITAKVFADTIDDAGHGAYRALRATGSGRLAALAYGIAPTVRAELLSYGFYRFECAIRSAAILGVVGAGGLGFQLSLSFTSLRYGEVWTALWALVLLNGAADAWSGWARRRSPAVLSADGARVRRPSGSAAFGTGVVLVPAVATSWWWLDVDASTLWASRTWEQLSHLAGELLPPSTFDGWWSLAGRALDTLALSVLAMAIAFPLAVAIAVVAAGAVGPPGVTGTTVRTAARAALLLIRAIPPPVWAIVVLFVVRPGPWPGAIALGAYNVGVLGRLLSEAVEAADHRPLRALRAAGATQSQAVAYATLPAVADRFTSLALYRWEVAIRETVVVGVVGAGGLGRSLDEALSAFAWSDVTGIVLALVAVTFAVDAASTALRRGGRSRPAGQLVAGSTPTAPGPRRTAQR